MTLIVLLAAASGCSTTAPKHVEAESTEAAAERGKLLSSIEARLQAIESRVTSLNDKVDSTRLSVDTLSSLVKTKPTEVISPPGEAIGVAPTVQDSPDDPEAGFINNEAIQDYRKALILFKGKKYPESILAFSDFIQRYPDHPMSGSAQYYVAESYFKQKEFKLALQEFHRVLASYDRSPHIADALRDLIITEESLQKKDEATRHRQILASAFGPSEPAWSLGNDPGSLKKDSSQEKVAKAPEVPSPLPPNSANSPNSTTSSPTSPISNEVPPTHESAPSHSAGSLDQPPTVGSAGIPPTAPLEDKVK